MGRTAQIQSQLVQAGFFHSNALAVFTGVRCVLAVVLAVAGVVVPFWAGLTAWRMIVLGCLVGGAAGGLGPSFWLAARVRRRQALLRGTLPDALDMLVLCLEGGVGLGGAVQRVTDELQVVHPVLGFEMDLVRREMQLGLSAGDALRKFADRCGLADVRDLANVLCQSERFGAGVAKALRGYADSARLARQQKARETAQKASVQILFPTLLFIFPAIFIVLLGPAAFQMAKLFSR
jgi:tight adherence protein C